MGVIVIIGSVIVFIGSTKFRIKIVGCISSRKVLKLCEYWVFCHLPMIVFDLGSTLTYNLNFASGLKNEKVKFLS